MRELMVLRDHNLSFKEGDSQQRLLLFAEAAIVIMTLERFLRIVPGVEAADTDTLFNLLQKATSESRNVLQLSAKDRDDAIRRITNVRNTILHGNFEQAATQAGVSSVNAFFKTQFASEVEALFKFTDSLVRQINPETGHRVS